MQFANSHVGMPVNFDHFVFLFFTILGSSKATRVYHCGSWLVCEDHSGLLAGAILCETQGVTCQ